MWSPPLVDLVPLNHQRPYEWINSYAWHWDEAVARPREAPHLIYGTLILPLSWLWMLLNVLILGKRAALVWGRNRDEMGVGRGGILPHQYGRFMANILVRRECASVPLTTAPMHACFLLPVTREACEHRLRPGFSVHVRPGYQPLRQHSL